MSESLQINVIQTGADTIILRLKGRLDDHTAPKLAERCSAALEGRLHVLLNLSDVSFVSSSGIGTFLALTEEFRERGVSLRLACVSQTVRLAITLLNIDDYLNIHKTEEEALKTRRAA